jgi:hypothetical protein
VEGLEVGRKLVTQGMLLLVVGTIMTSRLSGLGDFGVLIIL